MIDKLRVYQVAKDFNISSEALLVILESLGAPAKSHMSTLDAPVVEMVRSKFREEKEVVQAEEARKHEVKAASAGDVRRPASPAPALAPAVVPPLAVVPLPVVVAPPAPPRAPAPRADAGPARPNRPPTAPARPRRSVDEKSVRDSVKKTLAGLEAAPKPKHYRKHDEDREALPTATVATVEHEEAIKVTDLASVAELAQQLGVKPPEVISKLMGLGVMATLNQRLDRDTIEMVALEFGYAVQFESEFGSEKLEEEDDVDRPEDLVSRAPVVTVMGHVDHGKTSLLDFIRKTNVVAGEKGGITQHIGAYEVKLANGRAVTFLDTPGHEAFTAMRARGARATDVVVLVVAADDRVMPQTVEAIDHARAAEVPIVVAITKVDKPDANTMLVKQELAHRNVLVEAYGGQVPCAEVSSKSGVGIEDLLELILLQSDLLELKADPHRRARGVVIESKIEQGRGIVATVLVQKGTLRVGEPFVCGQQHGKVRAMSDERGRRVKEAPPSTPVEVMGWSGNPLAGDLFTVAENEAQAREVGQRRQLLAREAEHHRKAPVSLTEFHEQMAKGEMQELRLIIKADVAGSVEVLSDQLGSLGSDEVKTHVLHAGVGQVNETDVLLADASNAVIIGFNVKVDPKAAQAAQRSRVDIRSYGIIYEAVEDVKHALAGLLKPEEVETVQGHAEVRQVFRISKSGTIAGCLVMQGTIARSHRIRLRREDEVVFQGRIGSLKRFKDDVREVAQSFECGIGLEGFNDLREGDIIEAYTVEEKARRL